MSICRAHKRTQPKYSCNASNALRVPTAPQTHESLCCSEAVDIRDDERLQRCCGTASWRQLADSWKRLLLSVVKNNHRLQLHHRRPSCSTGPSVSTHRTIAWDQVSPHPSQHYHLSNRRQCAYVLLRWPQTRLTVSSNNDALQTSRDLTGNAAQPRTTRQYLYTVTGRLPTT